MGWMDEYNSLKKKKPKQTTTTSASSTKPTSGDRTSPATSKSSGGSWMDEYQELKQKRQPKEGNVASRVEARTGKKEDDRKWYQKGLFEDGYDFGDLTKTILGISDDTASLKDLTVNSLKRGYYNSLYGEESYDAMLGKENKKDEYKELLESDEYQFTPGNKVASAVSGAAELLGQQYRQFTNPRTLAFTGSAVGAAIIAGNAGPQALVPEEIISVPAVATAAFKAGSATSNFEIEAGHAYNEMVEMGVKEDIAKKIALAVGGGNAGLELIQADELADAYKSVGKKEATQSVAKLIAKELADRGVDVFKETAQEVAQEGITVGGIQLASKLDKGEYAYSAEDVAKRLLDTAESSALSFGMMNVPATARNTYSIVKDNQLAPTKAVQYEEHPIVEQKTEQETKPQVEESSTADKFVSEIESIAEKAELQKLYDERKSLNDTLMSRYNEQLYNEETENLAKQWQIVNNKIADMEASLNQAETSKQSAVQPEANQRELSSTEKVQKHFRDDVLAFDKLFDSDNPENVAKFEAISYATENAQDFISKGTEGVKGIPQIFGRISEIGDLDDFERYLRHLLNVDRTTVEQRFGTPDRKVFDYTTEESQKIADELEEAHPEFKQAAEDVYAFNNYLLDLRVKAGRTTQEWANRWREMYPHYVPISRSRYGDTQAYTTLLNFIQGKPLDTSNSGSVDSFLGDVDEAAKVREITSYGEDFNPLIDTMVNQAFSVYWDLAANQPGSVVAPTFNDSNVQTAPLVNDMVSDVEQTQPETDTVTIESKPPADSLKLTEYDPNNLMDNKKGVAKVIQDVTNAFEEYILDHGFVFEKVAKKVGSSLDASWHAIRNSFSSAQHFIGKGNEAKGVRALTDILKDVNKTNAKAEFLSYLGHLRNIDGMSLQSRFGLVNNRNFMGKQETFAKSNKAVRELEKSHPEFKKLADDCYAITDYIRNQFVERGMISQEDADLWKELYPHYVPMRFTGKGSVDSMLETLAQYTSESFNTWAMNEFGVELKNTLQTEVGREPMNIDSFISRLDSGDSLFTFGENGDHHTFTVYENGELVEFDITDEMYMALNDNHKWMDWKIPVLYQVNEGFRKFCTEWNIFFSLKNGVKDPQDIIYNSRHPIETYTHLLDAGEAIVQREKGQTSKYSHYYEEYLANGGESVDYFNPKKGKFTSWTDLSELIQYGTGLKAVSAINDRVEKLPRFAEYIASREAGRTVKEAMLDSARVTTNFAAGGKFTKFLNRNGCTFLNASVQGALQHARNFAEASTTEDGKLHFDTKEAKMAVFKGITALIARGLAVGMATIAINDLRWKDDEEYEKLPDYVKDSYYLLFKFGDGQFFRLPKGRTNATIEKGIRTVAEESFGDDNADWNSFWKTVIENIAPNNLLTDNIFAPIREVAKGETWYGEDMIPYRLKDLPTTEQFDEKTDRISVGLSEKLEDKLNDITLDEWLNEKIDGTAVGEWLANSGFGDGLSPKEINYLINSYTGVLGDLVLPHYTPKAESPYDNPVAQALAPLKDIFTTDSVLNSKVTGDFYEKLEAAEAKAESGNATKEDKLKSGILIGYNVEISKLMEEQRDIQTSDLPDSEKYERTRELKKEINALQEEGLKAVEDYSVDGVFAEAGDKRYNYSEEDDTWWEVKPELADGKENWYYIQEQLSHDKLGMSYADFWNGRKPPSDFEGKTYYAEYDGKRYNYDAEDNAWYEIKPKTKDGEDNYFYQQEQLAHDKLGVSYEDFWNNREAYMDANYVADRWGEPFYETAKNVFGAEHFAEIASGMANISADKDANGNSISGSRKKKMEAYIYGLDIPNIEKHILFKSQYSYTNKHNYEIVDYLNEREDISYEEMESILTELGFKVDANGNIRW